MATRTIVTRDTLYDALSGYHNDVIIPIMADSGNGATASNSGYRLFIKKIGNRRPSADEHGERLLELGLTGSCGEDLRTVPEGYHMRVYMEKRLTRGNSKVSREDKHMYHQRVWQQAHLCLTGEKRYINEFGSFTQCGEENIRFIETVYDVLQKFRKNPFAQLAYLFDSPHYTDFTNVPDGFGERMIANISCLFSERVHAQNQKSYAFFINNSKFVTFHYSSGDGHVSHGSMDVPHIVLRFVLMKELSELKRVVPISHVDVRIRMVAIAIGGVVQPKNASYLITDCDTGYITYNEVYRYNTNLSEDFDAYRFDLAQVSRPNWCYVSCGDYPYLFEDTPQVWSVAGAQRFSLKNGNARKLTMPR